MQRFGKLLSVCRVEVHTIRMGKFSCPALKSALLHSPATRDRATQVAELLSNPKPERIEGAVLDSCSMYATDLTLGFTQHWILKLNNRKSSNHLFLDKSDPSNPQSEKWHTFLTRMCRKIKICLENVYENVISPPSQSEHDLHSAVFQLYSCPASLEWSLSLLVCKQNMIVSGNIGTSGELARVVEFDKARCERIQNLQQIIPAHEK